MTSQEIARATEAFLAQGGKIEKIKGPELHPAWMQDRLMAELDDTYETTRVDYTEAEL